MYFSFPIKGQSGSRKFITESFIIYYYEKFINLHSCSFICWLNCGKSSRAYTDKKENKIFPIYKEIQNRAVAKSYMANGLLKYGEIFAHFLIYQEAPPHI
jgi:hypothetical protein